MASPSTDSLLLRRLEPSDYDKGFITLLSQLSKTHEVTREEFTTRCEEMKALSSTYHTMVIEDTSTRKIIATATLLVELKFLRACGKAAHVEDVVVDASYRGRRLGQRVVDALVAEARARGCYKIILNCSEGNVPFYERLGFKVKDVQMVIYLDDDRGGGKTSARL